MNKIKVNLLHVTPEIVVIKAVSKPYATEKANRELVKKVGLIYKHQSVLEHITMNFEILGISRLCLQELVRHRIASYTVESTRFTLQKLDIEKHFSEYFVIPHELKDNNAYKNYCEKRLHSLYYNQNKNDVKKYFLPENFRTNLIMSINLRAFLNFLELREASGAHFEIKHLANLMRTEIESTYIGELIK